MRSDDYLIFESYKRSLVIEQDAATEQKPTEATEPGESWYVTVGKILDPTGVSSWGDLRKAIAEYNKNPEDIFNIALVILGIYSVIPNFGLLVGGVGGIGWAAVKAAAKGVSKDPKAAVTAAELALKGASKFKPARELMLKTVDKLATKGTISPISKDVLTKVINKGSVKDLPGYGKLLNSPTAATAKGAVTAGKKDIIKDVAAQTAKGAMPTKLKTMGRAGFVGGTAIQDAGKNFEAELEKELSSDEATEVGEGEGASSEEEGTSAETSTDTVEVPGGEAGQSADLPSPNSMSGSALDQPAAAKSPLSIENKYFIDKGDGRIVPASLEDVADKTKQLYMRNPNKGRGEHHKPEYVRVRREGRDGLDLRRQSQFGGAMGSASNLLGDIGNTLSKPFRR